MIILLVQVSVVTTASKNTQTPSSRIYQVFTLIITLWLLYLVIIKFRKKRSQN